MFVMRIWYNNWAIPISWVQCQQIIYEQLKTVNIIEHVMEVGFFAPSS